MYKIIKYSGELMRAKIYKEDIEMNIKKMISVNDITHSNVIHVDLVSGILAIPVRIQSLTILF